MPQANDAPEVEKPSKSDNFLKAVELMSVAAIAGAMWIAALFIGVWVLFGSGDAQKARLGKAINSINLNWKIGLLLLIPLFFRTIRTILERMEKGPLGTEFPRLKPTPSQQDAPEESRPTPEGTK